GVAVGERDRTSVVGQREFTGEQILMHPHTTQIVRGDRAQRERAVPVVDDRDTVVARRGESLGRDIENQPVGGIDRIQVHRFHVGVPPQPAQYVVDLVHPYSVLDRCHTVTPTPVVALSTIRPTRNSGAYRQGVSGDGYTIRVSRRPEY